MASAATHIVLANKVFNKFFKDKNRKDFFIGTSLPDIRYLSAIDKSKTHFKNISLDSLINESSLLAGLKFHSIVDEIVENYAISQGIYALCPESEHKAKVIKILGDRLFYGFIDSWSEYVVLFNEILPAEVELGLKRGDLQKWHSALQRYFSKSPCYESMLNFRSVMGFEKIVIDEWEKNIQQAQQNKKIIKIVKNLYKDFDLLLEKYFKEN